MIFSFALAAGTYFWDFFNDDFWDEFAYEIAKDKLYSFTEKEFDLALTRYFHYYQLKCQIQGDAHVKCHQPLLLRFFCEAYGSLQ